MGLLRRRPRLAEPRNLRDETVMDPVTGAVRSVQTADLVLPDAALADLWTPTHLERLARTYWRFLSRVTAYLVTVRYFEGGRKVVALGFIPLLTFQVPEYEMDATRGIVRWRIEKGLLVSREGRGGKGYLEIDVRREPADRPGCSLVHVEVEVANFYPSIASSLSGWLYRNTQSRAHVLVTYGFLRSLARGDLAESRAGRYAPRIDQVPDPG